MASILVNPSAITALQSLRATQASLSTTQKEISTGLKISSAADNASRWAIAESMKSDKGVLTMVSDSLSGANSVLNVASAAVKSAIGVMNDIKSNIVQAQQPGADTAKILTSLQQLGKQLTSIVSSATFTGINATDGSRTTPLKFIASYNDGMGTNDSSVGTIDLNLQTLIDSQGGGGGILEASQGGNAGAATNFTNLTSSDLSSGTIGDTLTNADKALADLTTFAAEIGATQTRVSQQNEFIKTMSEALNNGLSQINDSLARANSVLSVAAEAVKNTISVVDEIKAGVVQAMQPGADQAKILTNLQQLGKQLTNIVTSSTFTGVNVLDTSQNNPLQFVASYANGRGSDSRVGYIDLPLSTLIDELGGHFGMIEAAQGVNITSPTDLTALTGYDLDANAIGDTLTNVDKAIADLSTYGSIIGVTQARVTQQRNLMKTMDEALSAGISALVDADMNEASTRLQALQAQQQLGVQSLSIVNETPQLILKLFQ